MSVSLILETQICYFFSAFFSSTGALVAAGADFADTPTGLGVLDLGIVPLPYLTYFPKIIF